MTMTKEIAQLRITRDLRDAEAALDELLLKQTALFSTMVTARRETGVEPFVGQEALMRLTKSQQTALSAGGELARVHANLLAVGREERMFDECPPNTPMKPSGQVACA